MKKYMKPIMQSEEFVANEFVTACSDTTREYVKFVCNSRTWILKGTVFEETNGTGEFEYDPLFGLGDKMLTKDYHPCNQTHYVLKENSEGVFSNGYLWAIDGEWGAKKVFIWKGNNGNNVHVTDALDSHKQVVTGNFSH